MKPRLFLLTGLALCALSVRGQSTAEPLQVELTLSAGRYPEAIASDTLHRLGQFGYSTVTGKAYRFAVQGQDEDDEIHGARGTRYSFEHRMHDPRVGRFLSLDPLAAKYPHNSPYAFSENRVIDAVELEGLEEVPYHEAAQRKREGLPLIVTKSEWLEEDRYCACRTFATAAEYNTRNLNSSAYEPINQVHNYYQWADNKLRSEGIDFRWFKAAEEVTAPNLGIGASQWEPAKSIGGFSDATSAFLAEGNAFLMRRNIAVVKDALATRSFQGLTGKEADYAMVEYEQKGLTFWMSLAERNMKPEEFDAIMTNLSDVLNNAPIERSYVANAKKTIGGPIDFRNESHRITLGKALVDEIRD